MNTLTILNRTIRQLDGLYSLNDLHKASGGQSKFKPFNFIRNDETQAMIAEIDRSSDLRNDKNRSPNMVNGKSRCSNMSIEEKSIACKIIKGGNTNQGTWVCKELVYKYAMWISPQFALTVIRTFDNLVTGNYKAPSQTTAQDRRHLVGAVNMLVRRKVLDYSTAYTLVNQYMGTQHIDEIPFDELPKAVEYELLHLRASIDKCLNLSNEFDLLHIANKVNEAIAFSKNHSIVSEHGQPLYDNGRIACYHGNVVVINSLI